MQISYRRWYHWSVKLLPFTFLHDHDPAAVPFPASYSSMCERKFWTLTSFTASSFPFNHFETVFQSRYSCRCFLPNKSSLVYPFPSPKSRTAGHVTPEDAASVKTSLPFNSWCFGPFVIFSLYAYTGACKEYHT
jgi:hypothetical protein